MAMSQPGQPDEEREKAVVHDSRRAGTVYGRLRDLPELTWEDFEKASRLAQEDVDPSA